MCVLGYCLAPVAGALIVCKILLIAEQTKFVFFLRLIATLIGFLWATYGKPLNEHVFVHCRRMFAHAILSLSLFHLQLRTYSWAIVSRQIEKRSPSIQFVSFILSCRGWSYRIQQRNRVHLFRCLCDSFCVCVCMCVIVIV